MMYGLETVTLLSRQMTERGAAEMKVLRLALGLTTMDRK